MTRRYLALVAALALAGTLVFPSAAVPLFDGTADGVGEGVVVAPADGPNGAYASFEDGDLALTLGSATAGVPRDAVARFDDVFRVGYDGDRNATVWVTSESPAVSFYAAGRTIDSPEDGVFLAGEESVTVGVRVDTRSASLPVVVENLTVHSRVADPPSDAGDEPESEDSPDVEAADGGAQTVVSTGGVRSFSMLAPPAGEPVALDTGALTVAEADGERAMLSSLSVVSAAGEGMSLTVERLPGVPDAAVAPGETAEPLGAVSVETRPGEAVSSAAFRLAVERDFLAAVDATADELVFLRESGGERSRIPLSVAERREDSVVVTGETPGFSTFVLAAERPALRVTDASLAAARAAANESVAVSVTVANDGGAAGERTVAVTANGSTVASRTVTVGPGETATVTTRVSLPPGEHAVSVAGVPAGTLSVGSQSGDDGGGGAPDAGGAGGAGDADGDAAGGDSAGDDESESVADVGPPGQSGGGPQQELANLGLLALPGVLVVAALGVTIVVLARRGARDDQ